MFFNAERENLTNVCVRERLRQKYRGTSIEKEREVHTEKLLINRVTVTLPPNEENVNTFFSIP